MQLTYSFGQRLAVSMYLKGTFPPLTQHDSQVTTNYATPVECRRQDNGYRGNVL